MRPASVAESERRLRFAELRSWANRLGEELRLTPLGLGLLAAAGRVPQRWEEQPEPARPQLERLARAGLIAADGMVVPSAQTAAEALATPGALLSIEASRGSASASWTAWFGTACAVIAATRPVDLPSLGDGPASLEGDDELTVQIGVPGWAPLAAAIWLELTPRPRQPPGELRVPRREFERRVDGAELPPPSGAKERLRSLWAQSLTLWGAKVTPGAGSILVLDAGVRGFWCVRREEDADGGTVILSPVASSQVWRDLLRLVLEVGLFDRQGPHQGR